MDVMKSKTAKFTVSAILIGLIFIIGGRVHADDGSHFFVGRFSDKNLEGWEPKAFVGKTQYSFVVVENETVLKAYSESAASGLIKKIRVDLEKTPYLNWRWRLEEPLGGIFDEKRKSGDDYAARVYVVVSGGFAIWNTRALNYVWAKHSSKGDTWPNAFASNNAIMKALRSSEDKTSVWYSEKRDVLNDFNHAFGTQVRFIDVVAIMSDTDNTKNKGTAFYGDIYFSAQ